MKRTGWVVIASVLFWARTASAGGNMIRVAIVDGQSAGAYHNWRLTTPVLKMELEVSNPTNGLTLGWPVAAGRTYRAQGLPGLTTNAWSEMGGRWLALGGQTTMEWMAPILAHASIAIGSSGIIGM